MYAEDQTTKKQTKELLVIFLNKKSTEQVIVAHFYSADLMITGMMRVH